LIAAELLRLAGVVDGDQLIDAGRVGYEGGNGGLQWCDPTDATG
jgi:hypothetical protein